MIYYLTYNEPYSGIFNSQVVDVVKHLRTEHQQEIRLISFVPIGFKMTYYKELSVKLRKAEPNCIIIPTVAQHYGWKFNWILLLVVLFFYKRGSVFSREIFATYLALKCRNLGIVKNVCHDGRGCNLGQMIEYDVYSDNIKNDIAIVEPYVVHQANFRLAVSNNLISYWQKHFLYQSNNHVVIPCTISEKYVTNKLDEMAIINNRKQLGFSDNDIILVFSGSNFGWQSFDLIRRFCEIQLNFDERIKIIFLSKEDLVINELTKTYKDRIICKWVAFEEVLDFLRMCDYGILLRESNDTNNVASPTKFAEYLAAGLSVIISDNLEFSKLVTDQNCGILVNNDALNALNCKRESFQEKERNIDIANHYFLKTSLVNLESYSKIVNFLR